MGYLGGFLVTLKKLFDKRLTTHYAKYPRREGAKPMRLHGRHVLNRYEDGMEKCIGCELCAGVCPARCIYVRGADNPPDDPVSPGERYGFVYEINYLRCIHCDLCVEACPTEAITESKLFEFSLHQPPATPSTPRTSWWSTTTAGPSSCPWEDWRDADDDEHTSAWMRATVAVGRRRLRGPGAWSGELGYGVRPPEQGQRRRRPRPTPPTADAILSHPREPGGHARRRTSPRRRATTGVTR